MARLAGRRSDQRALERELAAAAPEDVAAIEGDLEHWRKHAGYLDYVMRPSETFARAYAHWIAFRSGSMPMLDEIDEALKRSPPEDLAAWNHGDFLPIAAAFDIMAVDQGWVTTTTPST